jgi:hypothetical protein
MVSIPPVLLKRLYVASSLRNEGASFSFQLYNQIATGTVVGLSHLTVDGQAYDLDGVTLTVGDETCPATSISADTPLAFPVGSKATIRVPGELAHGRHAVEVTVQTREAGSLTCPVIDVIV